MISLQQDCKLSGLFASVDGAVGMTGCLRALSRPELMLNKLSTSAYNVNWVQPIVSRHNELNKVGDSHREWLVFKRTCQNSMA